MYQNYKRNIYCGIDGIKLNKSKCSSCYFVGQKPGGKEEDLPKTWTEEKSGCTEPERGLETMTE